MFYQSGSSIEHFTADFTNMQYGFEVCWYMFHDQIFLMVLFVANGAGVIFLSVDVEVGLAGGERGEQQPALTTPIVAVSLMLALMKNQISGRFKYHTASILRACVNIDGMYHAQVLPQSWFGAECVTAFHTSEWLIIRRASIMECFSMEHEERQPRETLAAFYTFKFISGHMKMAMVSKQMVFVVLFPTNITGVYKFFV